MPRLVKEAKWVYGWMVVGIVLFVLVMGVWVCLWVPPSP